MTLDRFKISAKATTKEEAYGAYAAAIKKLTQAGLSVSCAESCTGGLMGKLFTDVSGASAVFYGGMITYTNHIKINKLGVSAETIETHTEVSFECAAEMAARAREYFETDIGLSATGFAGPGGGNANDPVGTVYVGCATADKVSVYRLSFGELSRDDIRFATAKFAVDLIK